MVCLFLGLCRVDVQTLAQLHGAAVALGSGVFVQLVGLFQSCVRRKYKPIAPNSKKPIKKIIMSVFMQIPPKIS